MDSHNGGRWHTLNACLHKSGIFFSKWQNPTPLSGTHHSQFEIEVGGGVE